MILAGPLWGAGEGLAAPQSPHRWDREPSARQWGHSVNACVSLHFKEKSCLDQMDCGLAGFSIICTAFLWHFDKESIFLQADTVHVLKLLRLFFLYTSYMLFPQPRISFPQLLHEVRKSIHSLRHLLTLLVLKKITCSIFSALVTQKGWLYHLRPTYVEFLLFSLWSLFRCFFQLITTGLSSHSFSKILQVRGTSEFRTTYYLQLPVGVGAALCDQTHCFRSTMYEYSH